MMRKLLAATLIGMVLAAPAAHALSCEPHSVVADYWRYQERAETYLPVWGKLTNFSKTRKDKADRTLLGSETKFSVYTATFAGFRASGTGFDEPFETEVTLVFPDFSMIGGGYDTADAVDMLPGLEGLVWLMQTDRGYQVTAELCSPLMDTDPDHRKQLLKCLGGGNCPKPG